MTRQKCYGCIPTSALEIRASAPTGGDDYSTGRIEFSLDFISHWQLTEHITLAGSSGVGTNGFGEFGLVPEDPTRDHYNAFSKSAVLGFELTECNDLYVEWFGIFSYGLEDDYSVSVFNIGLDHYVTNNLVVDFRTGVGLTNDSDDFFAGVGGGYRF